jgi:ParB-like chromosome segregation protein Spo0J
MTDLAVIYRKIAELVPYGRNARTHSDAQIAQIAKAIQEFGWTNPVLVDERSQLIAGHGRVAAASLLGMADVPTICITGLTEQQRRALIIADNKLALNAGWDDALLTSELQALRAEDFDMALLGFGQDELNRLLPPGLGPVQAPQRAAIDGSIGKPSSPIRGCGVPPFSRMLFAS